MRVAYVINSLEAGGAQFPIPRIHAGLAERGVELTVYALSDRDGLSIPKLEAAGVPMVRSGLPKTSHVKAARWLKAELKRDRPDVIWTSLTQATLIGQRVGRSLGTPVVSWQHNAFLKNANRRLLHWQRRMSAFWVADSESVADFTHDTLGVPKDSILVLPLYVAPANAPQATAHAGGRFEWLSVGRLHRNKGYDVLIRALGQLESGPFACDDYRLRIAGDGAERTTLEALIAQHGLSDRVELLGHVDDIPALLATAHGYLQPSWNEGLGIAAHEAMAAGLPCLVSRTGQMALTVSPRCVVPPGDANAWARTLHHVMGDLAAFSATGARNRARVLDRFSAERFDTALDAIVSRMSSITKPS